jgi:hypothetical protein
LKAAAKEMENKPFSGLDKEVSFLEMLCKYRYKCDQTLESQKVSHNCGGFKPNLKV